MESIRSHFTEANGIRLHYLRGGSGRTLVLLHGWPEWSHVWQPVMSRLAGEFDLVAPDFAFTGAELASEEKNRLSHRARAAAEMVKNLRGVNRA